MAYIIAFLVLAVAFLTSPIWGTMYGGWRRWERSAFPKHQHGNGRRRGIV